ncbi:MAG: putative signal transducing protein, partial [Pirellulaceae bacterium]
MALFKKRDDDLVRLKMFDSEPAAHALRLLLEANGIQASVSGEESHAVLGNLGLTSAGLTGVEVLVRRADLEEARLVMNEVPAACDALVPAWACVCGAQVDQGFMVCWSCG